MKTKAANYKFGDARVKKEGTTTPAAHFTKWSAEITDTFGGEANYSWVNRYKATLPTAATDRQVVQHFKKLMGYTGIHCKRSEFGETIELRPYGECVVIFITPDY